LSSFVIAKKKRKDNDKSPNTSSFFTLEEKAKRGSSSSFTIKMMTENVENDNKLGGSLLSSTT
jgi:hypothetical protein